MANIINNSACVKLEDLCITKEKLAWCLYADLVCLDYDGAVVDACIVALISALRTVTLPHVQHDIELDTKLVDNNNRKPLPVYTIPVSTTFAIFEE